MIMPDIQDMLLALLFLILAGIAARIQRSLPPSCRCDDAAQGRECRNCQPPRLPR